MIPSANMKSYCGSADIFEVFSGGVQNTSDCFECAEMNSSRQTQAIYSFLSHPKTQFHHFNPWPTCSGTLRNLLPSGTRILWVPPIPPCLVASLAAPYIRTRIVLSLRHSCCHDFIAIEEEVKHLIHVKMYCRSFHFAKPKKDLLAHVGNL